MSEFDGQNPEQLNQTTLEIRLPSPHHEIVSKLAQELDVDEEVIITRAVEFYLMHRTISENDEMFHLAENETERQEHDEFGELLLYSFSPPVMGAKYMMGPITYEEFKELDDIPYADFYGELVKVGYVFNSEQILSLILLEQWSSKEEIVRRFGSSEQINNQTEVFDKNSPHYADFEFQLEMAIELMYYRCVGENLGYTFFQGLQGFEGDRLDFVPFGKVLSSNKSQYMGVDDE